MGGRTRLTGRDLEREVRRLRAWMSDDDIAIALGEAAGIFSARIGGLTLDEAGRRYGGVTRQAVFERLRQAGLPTRDADYRQRRNREFARWLGADIRRDWARGAAPREIADKYGLSVDVVETIVQEVVKNEDRHARAVTARDRRLRSSPAPSSKRAVPPGQEGLRAAVGYVLLAQRLNGGDPPSRSEYAAIARDHRDLPSIATLTAEFTYGEIQVAAGHREEAESRRVRWSVDACWAALRTVAEELGDPRRPPTRQEYAQVSAGRDDLHSPTIIYRRVGSWRAVNRDWPGAATT